MSSESLPPVPIPPAQRLRQLRTKVLPPVVFVGVLAIISILWRENVAAPTMIGQAEPVTSNVTSYKPGVLTELTVERFQKVRAGQVIGKVMVADPEMLEASLAVVRSEMDDLRADPQRFFPERRFAVDYAQLRLDWMRQRADLATAKVSLQLAEVELRRNEQLLKDKLVSESIFDLAKATRDALQKQVDELDRLVTEGESTFTALRESNPSSYSNLVSGVMGLQEARLRLAEAELTPVILKAPIDGIITTVSNRAGESVVAGRPIVTIATLNPVRIVGYLRPPLQIEPTPGMKVEVRTRSMPRRSVETVITEIGTQFEMLPMPMQSALRIATVEMGLPVEVALPPGLGLKAGELVDINLRRVD